MIHYMHFLQFFLKKLNSLSGASHNYYLGSKFIYFHFALMMSTIDERDNVVIYIFKNDEIYNVLNLFQIGKREINVGVV